MLTHIGNYLWLWEKPETPKVPKVPEATVRSSRHTTIGAVEKLLRDNAGQPIVFRTPIDVINHTLLRENNASIQSLFIKFFAKEEINITADLPSNVTMQDGTAKELTDADKTPFLRGIKRCGIAITFLTEWLMKDVAKMVAEKTFTVQITHYKILENNQVKLTVRLIASHDSTEKNI